MAKPWPPPGSTGHQRPVLMSQLLENLDPKEDNMQTYLRYVEVRSLQLGDWVRFPEAYNYNSVAVIPTGTQGHVVSTPDELDGTFDIYLHSYVSALDEWDNIVTFNPEDHETRADFDQALRAAIEIVPRDDQMTPTIYAEWHLRKVKKLVDNALRSVAEGGRQSDYCDGLLHYLEGNPKAEIDAMMTVRFINDWRQSHGV